MTDNSNHNKQTYQTKARLFVKHVVTILSINQSAQTTMRCYRIRQSSSAHRHLGQQPKQDIPYTSLTSTLRTIFPQTQWAPHANVSLGQKNFSRVFSLSCHSRISSISEEFRSAGLASSLVLPTCSRRCSYDQGISQSYGSWTGNTKRARTTMVRGTSTSMTRN